MIPYLLDTVPLGPSYDGLPFVHEFRYERYGYSYTKETKNLIMTMNVLKLIDARINVKALYIDGTKCLDPVRVQRLQDFLITRTLNSSTEGGFDSVRGNMSWGVGLAFDLIVRRHNNNIFDLAPTVYSDGTTESAFITQPMLPGTPGSHNPGPFERRFFQMMGATVVPSELETSSTGSSSSSSSSSSYWSYLSSSPTAVDSQSGSSSSSSDSSLTSTTDKETVSTSSDKKQLLLTNGEKNPSMFGYEEYKKDNGDF